MKNQRTPQRVLAEIAAIKRMERGHTRTIYGHAGNREAPTTSACHRNSKGDVRCCLDAAAASSGPVLARQAQFAVPKRRARIRSYSGAHTYRRRGFLVDLRVSNIELIV